MTNKMLLPLHIRTSVISRMDVIFVSHMHRQLHYCICQLSCCLPLNFHQKIYMNVPILLFRDFPGSRTPWLLHEEGGNK